MPEPIRNYCSNCRRLTNHKILHAKKVSGHEDDFSWHEAFQIVECLGCENVCFRKEYGDQDMIYYDEANGDAEYYTDVNNYPLHLDGHIPLDYTHFLPHSIRVVYHETIEALKVKSYILTAVGFRTIIEAICLDNNVSGKNLEQKIKNLSKDRFITENEEKRLHSIRFLGNDSVHEMTVPPKAKLFTVLEIVEHLLKNIYLIDKVSMSSLETVIDTFENFMILVEEKVNGAKSGEVRTLKNILGKDSRRLGDNFAALEQKLINSIKTGDTTYLLLKQSPQGAPNIQHYTIAIAEDPLPF